MTTEDRLRDALRKLLQALAEAEPSISGPLKAMRRLAAAIEEAERAVLSK